VLFLLVFAHARSRFALAARSNDVVDLDLFSVSPSFLFISKHSNSLFFSYCIIINLSISLSKKENAKKNPSFYFIFDQR